MRLGKAETIPIKACGQSIDKSPQEVTALLLRHLSSHFDKRISNPVLTVPAIFDQGQKDATMQAGRLAQTNIAQLIEEPTAAVLYQIFEEYRQNGTDFFGITNTKTVLVFDFGGGTLDLSLIRLTLEGNDIKPEVLAIDGDPGLGGNIIDFLFTKRVLDGLAKKYSGDSFVLRAQKEFDAYFANYRDKNILRFNDHVPYDIKTFIFQLKRTLEKVKINLSEKDRETIYIGRDYETVPITRRQFEKSVLEYSGITNADINERIRNALQRIIAKAPYTPVNEVLLVGGSSQIPYVQQLILDNFRSVHMNMNAIKTSSDHIHAVAMGAAIQAALNAGLSVPPFRKNKCSSVVARDIILNIGNTSENNLRKRLEETVQQSVILPMELEFDRLSKGEKQVFVMSLYWAIMNQSNNEIPFIIDTPFARIDADHRDNITKHFFTQLKGQLFVMSTDEELSQHHLASMADQIAELYMLEYDEIRKRTYARQHTYFEV